MRGRIGRFGRVHMVSEPGDRDTAGIRRTDKLLALLEDRLASHHTDGLVDWLRASPIAGADETSRACVMLRLNRIADSTVRTMARDVLR